MVSDFCKECGNPLGGSDSFCPECGHHFTTQTVPPERKSKTTKRKKVLIGCVAAVAIILFSTNSFIKSSLAPEKQLTSIYEALHERSGEKFFDVVHIDGTATNDPEVYMENFEFEDLTSVYEDIVTAVQETENNRLPQFVALSSIGDFLKVERVKFLGLYDEIKFTSLAYTAKFDTDLPSGKLTIGDKEWDFNGKPIDLGRFLPGYYTAVLTNEEFGKTSMEIELMITSNTSDNVVTLEKNRFMVTLEDSNRDSLVLIDGKETGKKVAELQEIGPFFSDASIELMIVQEKNGERFESEVVEAFPGEFVSFVFIEDLVPEEISSVAEEIEEEVYEEIAEESAEEIVVEQPGNDIGEMAQQFVKEFRSTYEVALNYNDFSVIKPFLLEGSSAYKELKEYMAGLKNGKYFYEFIVTDTVSWVSTSVETVDVETYEEFNFTNEKGQLTHYKRSKVYHLIQNENRDLKIKAISIRDTVRK